MTREQAKSRAEEIVYCYYTLGDILESCEKAGIPTRTPRGKEIPRATLERQLIKHLTDINTSSQKENDL